MQKEIEELQEKLRIAKQALTDIKNWDDNLEDEWGDPGIRASKALEKLKLKHHNSQNKSDEKEN